jgi:hypothetical protein
VKGRYQEVDFQGRPGDPGLGGFFGSGVTQLPSVEGTIFSPLFAASKS